MYNGLARKQVSLSEQDCYLSADLMLQQDAEGRCEGDFHWNIHLFRHLHHYPGLKVSHSFSQWPAKALHNSDELRQGPGNVSEAYV